MEITTLGEAEQVLYGLPAEEFTEARNTMVKQIRAEGDRDLANEVKVLRRPSAIAAEVNRIVRADPAGVELILQAAGLLRDAQTGALAGSSIDASELQQQYRAAIRALAQSATTKPAEVRAALEAATIDESSNDALRAGCLVAVPTPTSIFGSAPPTDGAVDELAVRRAEKASRETTSRKAAARASKEAAKAEEEAAEAEVEAAAKAERARLERERAEQQALVAAAIEAHNAAVEDHRLAEAAERDTTDAVHAAESELAGMRERRAELERQLAALAEQESAAEAHLASAQRAAEAAATQAVDAATALAELASALEDASAALAALE